MRLGCRGLHPLTVFSTSDKGKPCVEGFIRNRDTQSLRRDVMRISNFCNPSKAPTFPVPTAECQNTPEPYRNPTSSLNLQLVIVTAHGQNPSSEYPAIRRERSKSSCTQRGIVSFGNSTPTLSLPYLQTLSQTCLGFLLRLRVQALALC